MHHLRKNLFKLNQQRKASPNRTTQHLRSQQVWVFNSKLLTFYSRLEEQLHECLRLKKSATSLSVTIGTLGYPLAPHLESNLVTYLYSDSTTIANMDESGWQNSFNSLNKSLISLSAVVGALGSPLTPYTESDLEIDLYSASTPIAIKTSPIVGSASTTSLNMWSHSRR
jgi:hypothetical protein